MTGGRVSCTSRRREKLCGNGCVPRRVPPTSACSRRWPPLNGSFSSICSFVSLREIEPAADPALAGASEAPSGQVRADSEEDAMRTIELSVRALAVALLATWVLAAAPSIAQTWPQRTVRVIVPLPPGIPTDLVCRLFADRLSERWRQPVVVENRQGADGIPALSGFVSARDDHTLLCSFPGIVTINPLIYERLPYDPSRDLVPVVSLSDNFIGIAVAGALKVSSLDDFVKLARSQPGKLNWAASPGNPLYGFAGLLKSAGIEMVQ